jgi:hypothetical protein
MVLAVMTLVFYTLLANGCIIPQPYEEPSDSGVNHRPEILVQSDPPPYGDGAEFSLFPGQEKTFYIDVDDPDGQELTLRVFINRQYDKSIATEVIPPSAYPHKVFQFAISGLCDELVNNLPGSYPLEIYVSDGGFVSTGTDLRQTPVGALRDNAVWTLDCLPSAGEDAG